MLFDWLFVLGWACSAVDGSVSKYVAFCIYDGVALGVLGPRASVFIAQQTNLVCECSAVLFPWDQFHAW